MAERCRNSWREKQKASCSIASSAQEMWLLSKWRVKRRRHRRALSGGMSGRPMKITRSGEVSFGAALGYRASPLLLFLSFRPIIPPNQQARKAIYQARESGADVVAFSYLWLSWRNNIITRMALGSSRGKKPATAREPKQEALARHEIRGRRRAGKSQSAKESSSK